MGIGSITVSSPSSNPTDPSGLRWTFPTADAGYESAHDAPRSFADIPNLRGVIFGDGWEQLHHVVRNILKTGLIAPPAAPGAATGAVASTPTAGTYDCAFGWYRTEDQAFSGTSPRYTLTHSSNKEIDWSSLTAPDDVDADYTRLYRTVAGGVTLYRVKDVDEDATTASDDVAEATLLERAPFDEAVYQGYETGYPPRARCLAYYKGRVFAGGARVSAEYLGFTANYTAGSKQVTINTGGVPTPEWIGRTLVRTGSSLRYTVMKVDEANNRVYLDRDFEGSSNYSNAASELYDLRDPYLLHWSETLLPNAWPVGNSVGGISSPTPDGITAMVPAFGVLVVFTRTGVWTVQETAAGTFEINHETETAGCVGPRAVVQADGMLFWLGADGIWAWSGAGEPECLSKPRALSGEVGGIHTTIGRLNTRQLECVVSCYDPVRRIIRWAVPLDNDVTNRYLIVLDLGRGTWAVDTCEDFTELVVVQDAGGKIRTLAGDIRGAVWELDVDESSDGVFGVDPAQAVGSTSGRTITLSGSPGLPTTNDGLAGCPLWHIDTSGNFTRYTISTNAAGTVTTTTPLGSMTAGDQILLGAIHWDIQSGRFHGGDIRDTKSVEDLVVSFAPVADTAAQAFVAYAVEQGTPAVRSSNYTVDLSTANGRAVLPIRQHGVLHQLRICGFAMGDAPTLTALELGFRYADREYR